MTENTEQSAPEVPRDDIILALAVKIRDESGGTVSLVDAMIQAEEELFAPKAESWPTSFTLTMHVKPRVSRWIVQTFGGHASLSIEERLAAYLVQIIGRTAVRVRRESEPPPELDRGTGAVTMRREHMQKLQGG